MNLLPDLCSTLWTSFPGRCPLLCMWSTANPWFVTSLSVMTINGLIQAHSHFYKSTLVNVSAFLQPASTFGITARLHSGKMLLPTFGNI